MTNKDYFAYYIARNVNGICQLQTGELRNQLMQVYRIVLLQSSAQLSIKKATVVMYISG